MATSRKRPRSPPPEPEYQLEPTDPENDALRMEIAILTEREQDLRYENDALRDDRARLSGKVERFERWIGNMFKSANELIQRPMMLQEYAPGIMKMVPVPATKAMVKPLSDDERAIVQEAMDKLIPPATTMLLAIAKLDPPMQPLEKVGRLVGLVPTGGHFKKGLLELKRRGFIVIVGGDRVRLANSFWKRKP